MGGPQVGRWDALNFPNRASGVLKASKGGKASNGAQEAPGAVKIRTKGGRLGAKNGELLAEKYSTRCCVKQARFKTNLGKNMAPC